MKPVIRKPINVLMLKRYNPMSPKEAAFREWLDSLSDQNYRYERIGIIGIKKYLPSGSYGPYENSYRWLLSYSQYSDSVQIRINQKLTEYGANSVSIEEFLASPEVPEKIRRSILFNMDLFL